jgi:hypothetical protein
MREPIHHAIDIDATPAAVWRVFSDLATWPRWFPNATAARLAFGAPWKKGSVLEVDLAVPVVGSLVLRLDVEEAEPAAHVRWVGKVWGIRGDHRYSFEDRGKWTRVTSHERFDGMLARLADSVAREAIDRQAHEALARLKQLVEDASANSGVG